MEELVSVSEGLSLLCAKKGGSCVARRTEQGLVGRVICPSSFPLRIFIWRQSRHPQNPSQYVDVALPPAKAVK